MFTVTEAAGVRLAGKLVRKQASADAAMRFTKKGRTWKLRVDKPAASDVAFAHAGRTVLVLDAKAAELLIDRTLDVHHTPAGPRLSLD